jgi:hypothetical protein
MGAIVVIGAVVFVLQRGPERREEQALAELAVAVEPDLTAVRLATERFRDLEVALAEGYIRDPLDLCDTADMMGRCEHHQGAAAHSHGEVTG